MPVAACQPPPFTLTSTFATREVGSLATPPMISVLLVLSPTWPPLPSATMRTRWPF